MVQRGRKVIKSNFKGLYEYVLNLNLDFYPHKTPSYSIPLKTKLDLEWI